MKRKVLSKVLRRRSKPSKKYPTTYETKLLNAKKGSAEFNQVMSDLTYKIIENNVSVGNLANATDEEVAAIEKKIAATLRENGVTNASAVAHDYMAKAVVNAAFAAYDGTEASYEHYKGLLTQYEGSAVAQQGMIGLKNAQDIYNISNLDVSQKLTALQELGYFFTTRHCSYAKPCKHIYYIF